MTKLFQILVIILCAVVFIIPGYTFFVINDSTLSLLFGQGTDLSTKFLTIFRLFGLYAFVMVWLQVMLGTFRLPLTKLFKNNMLKLHMTTGLFTLLFALLHPFFFYVAYFFSEKGLFSIFLLKDYLGDMEIYGLAGAAALTVMVVTVSTAKLRTRPFIQRYWRVIHYGNYLVFALAFIHSFKIGAEVSMQPLQALYIFFGVTFIAGLLYRRILPLIKSLSASAVAREGEKGSKKISNGKYPISNVK